MKAISFCNQSFWGLFLISAVLCFMSFKAKAEEYNVKREAVFEFAKKPVITRKGDNVSIAFETKGYCDVTIAIENSTGKIIRHLVSGVLGNNAPAPFKKDSKEQVIIWDGKDDQEKYAANKDDLIIRVSLGLKPQFERSLFQSPYKRFGRNQPAMAAAPEGVYVYEGDITDNIKLFDHQGNYVRTVYPFPNSKLKEVKGLRWNKTIDGEEVPLKEGSHQATFFGSGYNGGYDKASGYGAYQLKSLHAYDGLPSDPGAESIAVIGNKLALVGFYLNCLSTDGSTGGLELKGSKSGVQVTPNYIYGNGPKNYEMMPRSAAFSPDGKWVYLTGYTWYEDRSTGGATRGWLHGVMRVSFDNKEEPKTFAGSLKYDNATAGNSNDKFNCATSVACDRNGLVYVSDYVNNRIQIFTPDGVFKESIATNRPSHVAIHQKTGELYVFSWDYFHSNRTTSEKVEPKMTILEGKDNHKMIAEYILPLGKKSGNNRWGGFMGAQYRVELDSWAETPTIWMVPETAGGGESWAQWGIKLLTVEKDKLVVKMDFGVEANKTIICDQASSGRQRLTLNPKDGKAYILSGMGTATGDRIVEIDPSNNKDKWLDLPFGAEDVCFDVNGLAYLRTGDIVVRYDPKTWKEIPWDYGVERDGVAHCGGRSAAVISGLPLPGARPGPWFHIGGFGISPKGHLVVQCFNGGLSQNSKMARPDEPKLTFKENNGYVAEVYPGRQSWGEIHIWDAYGKVVSQDVIPGIAITDGVQIDKDDNVYALMNPMRTPNGKKVFNPLTETLVKYKPKNGKIITSGNAVPLVIPDAQKPKKPTDVYGYYQDPAWVEGAEWMFGGVGYGGTWRCVCWNARFSLDYYARSFAPEPDRFSVVVLDSNGNVMLRIGKPGNIDDGVPLIADPYIKAPRSIGGDETAIMHACYVTVDTDKRLLIEDQGNRKITSVKINYYTDEKFSLKDVLDQEAKK
jgi:hypothetical protein